MFSRAGTSATTSLRKSDEQIGSRGGHDLTAAAPKGSWKRILVPGVDDGTRTPCLQQAVNDLREFRGECAPVALANVYSGRPVLEEALTERHLGACLDQSLGQ